MCGIFGLIDFAEGAEKHKAQINRATDIMRHRGPDGRGVWIDGPAAFGHRRLAIIDPVGSPQPMLSADGRYALTYNGELYNYKILRDELISEGDRFITAGDTEVVLKSIVRWGTEAFVKFNGMFALGFWDKKLAQLVIARDRLSVKPLFYSIIDNKFAFASEYPPVLHLDWISRTPDPVGLTAYLSHFQTTFGDRTIYRDISSLNGGEYGIFDNREFTKRRYWKLPIVSSQEKRDRWPDSRFSEAALTVNTLMSNAVKANSIADVDIGVFLSGGIDSAIITTLMCEQSKERVKAFSIGFAEQGFNEFEFSSSITGDLGLYHKIVTFDEGEYFPMMRELIQHKGAPLSTPNEMPIYALAKIASKELKVVLTGEGSDELFGGYTGIFRSPEDYVRSEQLRNNPEGFSADERTSIRQMLKQYYGKIGFKSELDHWTTTYAWLNRNELAQVLGPDINLKSVVEEIDASWQTRFDALQGLSTFDRYLYIFETEHLRGLLARLDACTMAGSLEGRVPFTENNLVEYVWGVPFEYKMKWRNHLDNQVAQTFNSLDESVIGKHILKEAFRGNISDTISARRKKAFPVPLETWMNGDGKRDILTKLRRANQGASRIMSKSTESWANQTLATGVGAMKVWMVWNLAEWLEGV